MSLRRILFLFLCIALAGGLDGCGGRQPILIGLAVELTGKQADVGINVRDAAQMAVDEVNANGGINGRPLQLVIMDDQGKPEVAQQVDADLVKQGVVAIIGHYTSGQTNAVLEQMNAAKIVLISPSASSSNFSGKADYFFRLIPDTAFIGGKMGEHIIKTHQLAYLVGVYDENNISYSKSYWDALSGAFSAAGGTSVAVPFKAGETDYQQLASQIADKKPGGLVIISSAVDTALIAQYVRQAGLDIPLFTSPWAQTSQLIEKGGQAVEGLEISAFYNSENKNPEHIAFVQEFQERYSRPPLLGTSQAYEIILVLAESLKITGGKAEGMPAALLRIKDFPGVLGPITFDEFGDVHRDIYILRVENGILVEQETIRAETP